MGAHPFSSCFVLLLRSPCDFSEARYRPRSFSVLCGGPTSFARRSTSEVFQQHTQGFLSLEDGEWASSSPGRAGPTAVRISHGGMATPFVESVPIRQPSSVLGFVLD